ncbi:glucosamine 6-phosphate N-acetyltransferase-like [Actinia tenebrosa]|uniref:Glucosamine 6-phosphate N-acetyltransferase n=1 Tax=Actinia tenebrosa TaxID=6105 RepID=A0A6P8IN30_ACTTE|nr:glucosamine 6-phosphate N-acetyltransferase-like [Actinia tenebrosa]
MANVSDMERVSLFDRKILDDVDLSKGKCNLLDFGISPSNPGENLCMRPLCSDDHEKDFIQLLSQLTKMGDITEEKFLRRFNAMKAHTGTYYIIVIENIKLGKIVACGSLIVEQKFIHETALRGRIEDIVVDDSCRGQKIGKLIVETLLLLSEKLGCYKTSLECKDPLLPFYTQFGFVAEPDQNHLIKRFFH